jgi:TRAP-type C4-dicarboxylate transport system permease small subunit
LPPDEPLDDGAPVDVRSHLDGLIAATAKPLAWIIFVAFAVSIWEVFARYVLNSPTIWAHETTTFLIALTFLVGGPIALARDRHIRVRMFYDNVKPGTKRVLDIVNSILALGFFAGLSYAAGTMVWKATHNPTGAVQLERTGTGWNPPTPALLKIAMLVCVLVMAVQTILHLVAAIRRRDR